MHFLICFFLLFNSSFLYAQPGQPVSRLSNTKPIEEKEVNSFLEARHRAVYNRFCTPEGKIKQNKFLLSTLELRLADLKKSDPVSFKKLPSKAELFVIVSSEVDKILKLDTVCMTETEKHENYSDFSHVATAGGTAGLYYLKESLAETYIHEVGHLAFGELFSEGGKNGAEITIVKHDTISRFISDLFQGEASFSGFIDVLNPFEVGGKSGSAQGWISGHWTSSLTGAGETVGFTAAKSLMLFGGVIFTSLSNILLIASGLKLRKTNPVLGYSLIFSAGFSYSMEILNWVVIGATGMASSDLVKAAALLGISPFAISGIMVGVSAAILATYIAIRAYKSHKKKIRISAQDLIENKAFDHISINKSNVSTQLYQNYSGKVALDKSIEGLVSSIETSMFERVKHTVDVELKEKQELERQREKLKAEGKDPEKAKLGKGFRIKRWFSNIGSPIGWIKKKYRIRNYNKQKKNFYSYIGGSNLVVNYSEQDKYGQKTLINILQGEYADGMLKRKFERNAMSSKEVQERFDKAQARVDSSKGKIKVKELVAANRQRLLHANVRSEDSISKRWKLAFKSGFEQLERNKVSLNNLLKLRIGPSKSMYIANNVRTFKRKMGQFSSAMRENNIKEVNKLSKEYLKERLKIRSANISDILIKKFTSIWGTYSKAISEQNSVEYEPTGMLQVVDDKTCQIEINFVCQVASTFFDSHAVGYTCPLKKRSCYELEVSKMLTSSNIDKLGSMLNDYFKASEEFYP